MKSKIIIKFVVYIFAILLINSQFLIGNNNFTDNQRLIINLLNEIKDNINNINNEELKTKIMDLQKKITIDDKNFSKFNSYKKSLLEFAEDTVKSSYDQTGNFDNEKFIKEYSNKIWLFTTYLVNISTVGRITKHTFLVKSKLKKLYKKIKKNLTLSEKDLTNLIYYEGLLISHRVAYRYLKIKNNK